MNHQMEPIKKSKIVNLVLTAISVHLLLLVAIMDVHFKSPLEVGLAPVKSTDYPPAKRLVIFIADGLRAQAVFDSNQNSTTYLTSVRTTRGSWGVSHTRVPTESRPNHVAILGGIYEDPSAVYKSWKKFPIDFDTVFNESRNSWVIGTEEITSIFNKNAQNNVKLLASPPELLDYKRENHQVLDEWVFKEMTSLLKNSGKTGALQESGIIFSLHLSGLDMTGHSKKPYSEEYFRNIRYVDRMVQKIEGLVNKTFPDNLTAFIFTSDHGMTDWGSHGSGSDHETFTPVIAWGAGVRRNKDRVDIQQIDIAPLISSILGLNYPVNSLGRVPIQYLNTSEDAAVEVSLNNLKQLYRILEVKQNRIVNNKFLFFHRRSHLTPENFNRTISEIAERSVNSTAGRKEALIESRMLFDKIVREIEYFDNYFMVTLISSVSMGFFLWILYVCTFFVPDFAVPKLETNEIRIQGGIFLVSSFFLVMLCYSQSFNFSYYFYILFPNVMLHLLLRKRKKLSYLFRELGEISLLECIQISLTGMFVMVAVISFYYRFCFSIVMVLVSCSMFLSQADTDSVHILSWMVLCLILSIFPLLPVMVTKFHVVYFVIGYVLWQYLNFCVFTKKWFRLRDGPDATTTQKIIFLIQNICLNVGFVMVLSNQDAAEFSSGVKATAWLVFLLPICLVPFSMTEKNLRLFTVFSAFIPFYLITSMCYELIFMSFYAVQLILWMNMEKKVAVEDADMLENLQKSLILVALIFIGYFGPGNIPTLNSFDPMWVKFLLSSFCPFTIAVLIFLKLTLPFLYATCVFRNVVLARKLNLTRCFCIILLISDVMVFYFMFNVTNEGSWAEIGLSLSYFIVVECFTIVILCLYFVAYVLTSVEASFEMLEELMRKFQLPT
ncbi:GPI ethanolamine phosphate transferase 1-like [Coccinella septempunctata]|uniref:GPI ethanolamine phosphate transferase 1-like n=1 Tax=Coccinella septempunctata TaxID=41139 RepID=UPI001D0860A4|nr:GPI ethanolamine phosphate transferase 1-like [Coccinella septempunctata]